MENCMGVVFWHLRPQVRTKTKSRLSVSLERTPCWHLFISRLPCTVHFIMLRLYNLSSTLIFPTNYQTYSDFTTAKTVVDTHDWVWNRYWCPEMNYGAHLSVVVAKTQKSIHVNWHTLVSYSPRTLGKIVPYNFSKCKFITLNFSSSICPPPPINQKVVGTPMPDVFHLGFISIPNRPFDGFKKSLAL